MSLDDAWADVREFHRCFGHPMGERPRPLEAERALARAAWMREEVDEFLEAPDVYRQADAMIDLVYFALGTLVEMGVKPQALFDVVQEANMTKLWPDGKPRYKEDGKVMKPETWQDPDPKLRRIIDEARA